MNNMQGLWIGRLLDIQGFEGNFSLELEQINEKNLSGTFKVTIQDEEACSCQEGVLKGTFLKDKFNLVFVPEKKDSMKIKMEGRVQSLKEQGLGFRAIYDVSGKSISPLKGGIASARTVKSLPSIKVAERSKFKDM